jgi:hypothetical protein
MSSFLQITSPLNQYIQLSHNRSNPLFIQKESSGYKGLCNLKELDGWLIGCNYACIIKSLWSEQLPEKKVVWLKEKEDAFHFPLLFEQSIEEFLINPTLKTASKISIPLIMAATIRLKQDLCCLNMDEEESHCIVDSLEGAYYEALTELTHRKLGISVPEILLIEDSGPNIIEKIDKMAKSTLGVTRESICWLLKNPSQEGAYKEESLWPKLRQAVLQNWFKEWTHAKA